MVVYAKRWEQGIKLDKDKLWKFISDPRNLAKITPKHMNFKILSEDLPNQVYPGLMIYYSLNPFPFFKVKWLTEITHVEVGHYFVDEQRFGPYKIWHHEHFIEEENGNLIMRDILHYSLPLGILGRIMNKLFISSKINSIFKHRKAAMEQLF